jgi:hypothetical protein
VCLAVAVSRLAVGSINLDHHDPGRGEMPALGRTQAM